jgi:hypothetical protein
MKIDFSKELIKSKNPKKKIIPEKTNWQPVKYIILGIITIDLMLIIPRLFK